MSINGGETSMITLSAEGLFEQPLSLDSMNVETQLTLTARTADGAEAIEVFSVTFDESPPEVRLFDLEEGDCSNTQELRICGRVLDAESGITRATLGGQTVHLEGQTDFCTVRFVNSGALTFILEGENGAGEISSTSVSILIDRIAPTITFDVPEGRWHPTNSSGLVELSGVLSNTGCPLTAQGFVLYPMIEGVDGQAQRGEGQRPPLTAEGQFTYQGLFADGARSLEVVLEDQGGNERTVTYDFLVDQTPPQVQLIDPEDVHHVGSAELLDFRLEITDFESGLVTRNAENMTANGEPLIVAQIPNSNPPIYEATGTLSFPEGAHVINVSVTDRVGNTQTLEFNYLRDVTPPLGQLISPLAHETVHSAEVVIINASDPEPQGSEEQPNGTLASGVESVEVNGVLAHFNGEHWIAEHVGLDLSDPTYSIEVIDQAGNRLSDSTPLVFNMNLHPYTLRPPLRSGLPEASDRFKESSALLWGEWREDALSLVGLTHINSEADDQGDEAEQERVALRGGWAGIPSMYEVFNLPVYAGQWRVNPQPRFPAGDALVEVQVGSIGDVLTILTLNREEGASLEAPSYLHAWRRASEGDEGVIVVGDPPETLDHFVEVELGLPAQAVSNFTLGDLTGDGRLDLLTVSSSGTALFTQTASPVTSDVTFVLEDSERVTELGLGDLHSEGRLWMIDINGDYIPDLIQGSTNIEPTKLWLNSIEGEEYSFQRDPLFPINEVKAWVQLDWDHDGVIDSLAWDGSALVHYDQEVDNSNWTRTITSITLSDNMNGLSVGDLNLDGEEEVITYGSFGVEAYQESGRVHQALLPDLVSNTGEISHMIPADIDGDGDEDWVISGLQEGQQTNGIWLMMNNGEIIRADLNTISLQISRGPVGRLDALHIVLRIDADGDFNFERTLLARPFSPTLLSFGGEGTANVQVVFPDRGPEGGHRINLFNSPYGTSLNVIDPQQ